MATRTATRSPASGAKLARLEARISESQKELFQRAADLTGRSLTDFVVSSLQEAAVRTVREHETLSLSAKDGRQFVAALLQPPMPSARLRKAAQRYKSMRED